MGNFKIGLIKVKNIIAISQINIFSLCLLLIAKQAKWIFIKACLVSNAEHQRDQKTYCC